MAWEWARATEHENFYEVSTKGDTRFSPLNARLRDGRTIEEAYQLDVKGYRARGYTDWQQAKRKPPLDKSIDLYAAYLTLWRQWARENPRLITQLAKLAAGKVLTDRFATSEVCQAHALADILNDREDI